MYGLDYQVFGCFASLFFLGAILGIFAFEKLIGNRFRERIESAGFYPKLNHFVATPNTRLERFFCQKIAQNEYGLSHYVPTRLERLLGAVGGLIGVALVTTILFLLL